MSWEFDILYALQNIHNPLLDKIMVFVSTLGNSGIFWIAVAILLMIPKKTRRMGFQTAITMLIVFIIGNLILKNAIHRPRPCWIDESVELLVKSPKDYSFPSGHSMNGLCASVTLLCCDKRFGIPAVILAVIIAFSRLYLFVHFPTDVIIGSLIGIISALVVNYFMNVRKSKVSA